MHVDYVGDPKQIAKDRSLFAALREGRDQQPDYAQQPSFSPPPFESFQEQEVEMTFEQWLKTIDEAEYHSKGAFKRLVNKLRAKGYSKDKASEVAASIGRQKYGKSKFQKMAKQGKEWHEKHEQLSLHPRDAFLEGFLTSILEDVVDGGDGGFSGTQSSNVGPYKRSVVGGSNQEEPENMNASQKEGLRKLMTNDHQLLNSMKQVHNQTSHPQVKAHLEREISRREHTLSMLGDILGNE